MWFWFFLAVALVTAVLIWDYRRKAAKRESVSRQRFQQLLKAGPTAAAPSGPAGDAVPEPVATGPAAPEGAPAPAYAARVRLLSPAETLVYYLLKSAIADHEVLAKVALATVVELPGSGYDREQQARRLSRYQLDFVVCDKSLKVVAAVQLAATGAESVVAQRIVAECLKSAGIRLVVIDPAALPKRAELRGMVCGSAGGGPDGPSPQV